MHVKRKRWSGMRCYVTTELYKISSVFLSGCNNESFKLHCLNWGTSGEVADNCRRMSEGRDDVVTLALPKITFIQSNNFV